MKGTGIIAFFARLKVFLGNGIGIVSDLKYPVLLAIPIKQWRPETTIFEMVLVGIILLALLMAMGWVDMRIIKFTPTVQEINTRENNLFFQQQEKDLNKLLASKK